MTSEDTAELIFKKHFPTVAQDMVEFELELMKPGFILLICDQSWENKKIISSNLDALMQSIVQFRKAYNALPNTLTQAANFPKQDEILRLIWSISGQNPAPHISSSQVHNNIYPKTPNPIDRARQVLDEKFSNLHHNQKLHEIPRKAALFAYCRDVWQRHKNTSAPRKPSQNTKFGNFVEDIISYCNKEWSLESVVNANKMENQF